MRDLFGDRQVLREERFGGHCAPYGEDSSEQASAASHELAFAWQRGFSEVEPDVSVFWQTASQGAPLGVGSPAGQRNFRKLSHMAEQSAADPVWSGPL